MSHPEELVSKLANALYQHDMIEGAAFDADHPEYRRGAILILDLFEVREEHAVKWADSIPGFRDVSKAAPTREGAQEMLDGSAFPGSIVHRYTLTTDWEEVK